jgi:hypothetical protein
MKLPAAKLFAVLAASGALVAALPAEARDGHRDRDDYREWRSDRHDHRHYRSHHKEHKKFRREHVVVKERVIVRERPIVREYSYYEAPVRHVYSRDPAVVIGFSIPPIVIPLR